MLPHEPHSVALGSKWERWGLLEGEDEIASPKLDAVIKWNRASLR